VFFLAEIYTPTFGALTMGGVIALVLGSVMLFKDADPALRAGLDVIVGTTGALLLVVLLLLRKAYQVRGTRVVTGVEGLLGERGVARTDIGAADKVFADKVFADKVFADKVFAGKVFAGKVFVHGELWRATADEPVPAGTPVEVIEVRGLELRVRAVAVRGVDQPS
jgi:membrane-bound serine protease (ClpP class)